ncbi:hypothetical protein RQP46_005802 [Phenoliferia psychrophenolica]
MARACFLSLPVELKVNILGLVALQEENWKANGTARLKQTSLKSKPQEKKSHINSLFAASLVDKEWRSLAAAFIFTAIDLEQAKSPLFHSTILPKHAHRFTQAHLLWSDEDDSDEGGADCDTETVSLDATLSILLLLPNLHTLWLTDDAAYQLWGDGLDFDSQRDADVAKWGIRRLTLRTLAQKISRLSLFRFRPAEAARILACWPKCGLRQLTLSQLTAEGGDANEDEIEHGLDSIAQSITSMKSLTHLYIKSLTSTGWSPDALAALRQDPPPLATLQFTCINIHKNDFDFVSTFSSSLKTLSLRYQHSEDLDVTPTPLILPSLTSLTITDTGKKKHTSLPKILSSFFSSPVTVLVIGDSSADIDLGESCPLTLLAKHFPNLKTLDVQPMDAKEVSFVAAHAAERGLPGPTPRLAFVLPEFVVGITDEENGLLCDALEGVLDWGKLEVGRLRAGGKVADSVALLESLRPLDEHRRRWMD